MAKSVLDRSMFAGGEIRSGLTLSVVAELEHSSRLSAYSEYWRFFKGKHWTWEREQDQPVVTVNYARRLTTVLSGWLMKRGFEIAIPDDPKTEGTEDTMERKFIEAALKATWEANGIRAWCLEAGQMGGVTGDLFLRPSWETESELEDPFVRVDILPSHYVFPEFGGAHGVDRKKMVQCMVLFPRYEHETTVFGKKRSAMRMDGEIWTKELWQRIENESIVETKKNPYGEIPIIHVPNTQLAGEFYGISDLVDLLELQKMYNEKMTDVSDVIDYHSSPVTIVEGMSTKRLEKAHSKMWGIRKGAKVYNLELKGDLVAANTYIDRLERLMLSLSGVPKEALGEIQDSANTSGVAMALRFMSLTDIRDMKEATYGLGIRRINRLILKTLILKDKPFAKKWDALKKKYPDSNLYRNTVKFNSPMPRDEIIELQKIKERLELRLSTRREELKEMGKSEEEIRITLKETAAELKAEAAAEFGFAEEGDVDEQEFNAFFDDSESDGRKNNKTPQGAGHDEKVSATASSKLPSTV